MSRQYYYYFAMQIYHHGLVGFPTKPKKILGPKITPPPQRHPRPPKKQKRFRAVNFFRKGESDTARQKMESNCLLLV